MDLVIVNATFHIPRAMSEIFVSQPLLAAAGRVEPHPATILPIALMPFIHKHWWDHHSLKVAVGLGLITAIYYVAFLKHGGRLPHTATSM